MTIETIQLDWRGMRCPEPILKTARKVRTLRNGTDQRIQIYADDDAFPMDIRSWCQSAGITLMGVEERDGYYEAILQLEETSSPHPQEPLTPPSIIATQPPLDESTRTSEAQTPAQTLDCVGMACPEPILKLARAYRKLEEGATLVITADDDAFPVDIKSWLKSSGAQLIQIDEQASPFKAVIQKPGVAPAITAAPKAEAPAPIIVQATSQAPPSTNALQLNLTGLSWEDACARLESMTGPAWTNETLEVRTTQPAHLQQVVSWLTAAGHQLIKFDAVEGLVRLGISGQASTLAMNASAGALVPARTKKRATFLVIHNDFESLMAALMVANTTAAQDIETSIFFSFWGVNLLRSDRPRHNEPKKPMTFIHRMFRWMMPVGPSRQPLSKMHFGGAGKAMMLASMRQQNVMDLETLMESAIESGVRFTVCTMSMGIMGIQKRDIMDRPNIDFAGVASFVADSANSDVSMVF